MMLSKTIVYFNSDLVSKNIQSCHWTMFYKIQFILKGILHCSNLYLVNQYRSNVLYFHIDYAWLDDKITQKFIFEYPHKTLDRSSLLS